jgi:predicted HTH transcriptional regulator
MTPDQLKALISGGENEKLELKSFVPPPDLIARYTASMANTEGGVLLFGVREPTEVVGVDDERARRAIEASQRLLSPSAKVTYEFVPVDGRIVAVVNIPKADGIVAAGGGYYRREGDITRPLTADEIRNHLAPSKSPDETIYDLSRAVAQQTQTIEIQTQTIEKLREDFNRANSPWKKVGIGVGCAILGAILKSLLDYALRR